MAYAESHDLVVAGDMIGNLFSWKVGDIGAANTDEGDFPPHHAFGSPSKATRYSGIAHFVLVVYVRHDLSRKVLVRCCF